MARQFSHCDLCGKPVEGTRNETVLMLRASYYKMDRKAYTLEYTLCANCREQFEEWINQSMTKGDDTT